MPTLTDGANINLNLVGSQLSVSVDGGSGSGLDADTVDGNHASAFATAAQGSLADSAVQPGDNIEVSDGGTIGSTSDSDAMAIASTGVVTFSQNIKLAASKGIDFSAYGAGGANLLDDYEEGTWTPQIKGNNTAGTYTISDFRARYTKIGERVWVDVHIDGFSTATGGVGALILFGLPFKYYDTSGIFSGEVGNCVLENTSLAEGNIAIERASTTSDDRLLVLVTVDSVSGQFIQFLDISDIDVTSLISVSFSYRVA